MTQKYGMFIAIYWAADVFLTIHYSHGRLSQASASFLHSMPNMSVHVHEPRQEIIFVC